MKKKNRYEIYVVIGILLICIGALIYTRITHKPGNIAVLSYDNNKEEYISLQQNARYDFDSNGYTIHIEVKNGRAAFVDSPCPDHICEHYGWLKHDGQLAVCLPAKATLRIRRDY